MTHRPGPASPSTRIPGASRLARGVVTIGALMLSLTACSTADTSTPASASPETAASAAPEEGSSGDAECREVEHVLGTACVPDEPQRIVTIDPIGALPTLLELGVPIVGASAVYDESNPFPDYVDPADVEGIEIVGTSAEPNFEGIAALDPDLIIGSELYVSQFQDKLDAIAPTVAVRDTFYTSELHDVLRSIAEVVGEEDLLDEKWTALEERQESLRTRLAAQYPDGLTATRVDGYPGKTYAYRWSCIWYGPVLEPLGFEEPAQQQAECDVYADWSTAVIDVADENIGILDADVVFGYSASLDGTEATPFSDTLATSPLWEKIAAVQNDRVFDFGDAWGFGASLPAAQQMLDDVEQALLG